MTEKHLHYGGASVKWSHTPFLFYHYADETLDFLALTGNVRQLHLLFKNHEHLFDSFLGKPG